MSNEISSPLSFGPPGPDYRSQICSHADIYAPPKSQSRSSKDLLTPTIGLHLAYTSVRLLCINRTYRQAFQTNAFKPGDDCLQVLADQHARSIKQEAHSFK